MGVTCCLSWSSNILLLHQVQLAPQGDQPEKKTFSEIECINIHTLYIRRTFRIYLVYKLIDVSQGAVEIFGKVTFFPFNQFLNVCIIRNRLSSAAGAQLGGGRDPSCIHTLAKDMS